MTMFIYSGRKFDMRRSRDDQFPYEKTKKAVHLERRGNVRNGVPVSAVIFWLLGACCSLYCGGIALMGFGTYFFLIWGMMGIAFLLIGRFLSKKELVDRVPLWVKAAALTLFFAGLLLFGSVEGLILSRYSATAEPGADYVIVLGAQWKPEGPSEVLRRRLDKAVQYLNDNSDTYVIVSGGQGSNEPVSEAAGMRQYLVDAGIEDGRILMEDASASTYENLVFSGRLLDLENDRVVIVTNNFHIFRALSIAQKQGYKNVEGLAASSLPGMAPHNLMREFLGVVKDFVVGNL